jgi:anti-sigma B factor antagonist
MDLKLRTRHTDGVIVIEVGGEVELHSAQQLRDELVQACKAEQPRIVVDLSGVSFIDSSGLGVLVGALKRVRERGMLSLACPQQRVRRVFEITGLTQVFPIYSRVEEAVAACSEASVAARGHLAAQPSARLQATSTAADAASDSGVSGRQAASSDLNTSGGSDG